ncbi:hypothetical protein [Actomonas aquatica]|uniref:DUF4350 domain-containing protein n=1 Tax=Actomonas aquatica TaxID=2866162 RepID=A0ABZ1C5G4_9BACT|nr:hypothetical protein [Opitutus sp. WL0086]WRQ86600.1 hypothetical protein K1X11_017450 [Opitutus sp. WL0086]
MKSRFTWVALLGLIVLLGAVIVQTYHRRIARDLYPLYSSLRADRLGLRVLHDTINELPGHQATRWKRDLADLRDTPDRVVLLAGLVPAEGEWLGMGNDARQALQRAAYAGNRVVLAFRPLRDVANLFGENQGIGDPNEDEDNDAEEEADPLPNDTAESTEGTFVSLGFALRRRYVHDDRGLATATDAARQRGLPSALRWRSDAALERMDDVEGSWQVLYTYGGRPVVMERALGRGSLVVMLETYPLSNEALHVAPEPSLVRWLLDGSRQVEFVEAHLGVREDPGLAALARRYGLSGALIVIALWALLLVWRRTVLFLPEPPEPATLDLTYEPTAGLEALLRRSVPPGKVMDTCVTEWKHTAPPREHERLQRQPGLSPVDEYNQISRELRPR